MRGPSIWEICHPLYVTERFKAPIERGKWKLFWYEYDIRLVGLEEKHKDINSYNDFLSYLASQNEWIFEVYKKNEIDINFDNIFKKWKKIAIKCGATPGDLGIFRELFRLKKIYYNIEKENKK
ncbi:hypothetical protein HY745_06625 [Candidatus Desantisbacteria bacterium]|nr:hypothetical protein [Candidatus Desantisbacteria bacterium]